MRQWAKNAARSGDLFAEYGQRFDDLPWTAETRPLGDAIVAAYTDLADLFQDRLSKVKNDRAINKGIEESDRTFGAIDEAGRTIRLAIGLPTVA